MKPHDSIQHLQQMMMDGGEKAFDIVPTILRNVLENRLWAERHDKNGDVFASFEAFVDHPLWHGLESSIDDLRLYCRKHPEVRQLIDAEVGPANEHGTNRFSRDRNTISTHPDTATGMLKRLKRDRPDLAEKVVAGEMSANAAAVEAGFRRKPTPFEQVLKLIPKLTDAELAELRSRLKDLA